VPCALCNQWVGAVIRHVQHRAPRRLQRAFSPPTAGFQLVRGLSDPRVLGIDPREVAALDDIERALERAREAVERRGVAHGIEVPGRVEVGHRLAVDGIPDRLTRIADLDQVLDALPFGIRGWAAAMRRLPKESAIISRVSWLIVTLQPSETATAANGCRVNALSGSPSRFSSQCSTSLAACTSLVWNSSRPISSSGSADSTTVIVTREVAELLKRVDRGAHRATTE
jgi:hypothetical protein